MSSDEVARERTLLEGTNDVINGNLLTLPVGDGQVVYVEPVYSKRKDQESAFPKLLRVLVSYNGQVGYAPTIAEALNQVGIDARAATDLEEVNGSVVHPSKDGGKKPKKDAKSSDKNKKGAAPAVPSGDAAERVRSAMDKVKETRQDGSFEEFGKALDELDKAVADLQSQQ